MKAVTLMSDGIDSPVAAYLMAKKGVEVICLTGKNSLEPDLTKVANLARTIRDASGGNVTLMAFNHYPNQEAFAAVNPKWVHCILCKRMMVRVASAYGERIGAECVVMGDSLGQVASQTLENIKVVESAASIPIVRPLIGLDKLEIENIGRKSGTYDISIVGQKVCAFVPEKPSVKGNMKVILKLEEKAGVEQLVETSLETVENIGL